MKLLERKLSSLDMEDLSAGSRDSEELSSTHEKENSEEKVFQCWFLNSLD